MPGKAGSTGNSGTDAGYPKDNSSSDEKKKWFGNERNLVLTCAALIREPSNLLSSILFQNAAL